MTYDITSKRWFMGKGQPVRQIDEMDRIEIAGCTLQILQVEFENNSRDLYATIEDESKTGAILAECFGGAPSVQIFKTDKGQFVFTRTSKIDKDALGQAIALGAEQSNSAFFVKGKYFFKLFRRLHAGLHPEQEILLQLNKKGFEGVPQLLGYAEYQTNGNSYAIGILENHIDGAKNAWDIFTEEPTPFLEHAAWLLGQTTAKMHLALKGLKGTGSQPEKPPFEKLIKLLKANRKKDLVPLVNKLSCSQESLLTKTTQGCFVPQRIHGDYHLGQLLFNGTNFTVLDFEGEPTRTLEFRRRLRSPAADIAGMLRSFAYAEAVRQANTPEEKRTAEPSSYGLNFLIGYSQESGIPIKQLEEESRPYILSKAVYEACYELEFRPDWFWIPEKALKEL
jgi:predicted trehalose synthase